MVFSPSKASVPDQLPIIVMTGFLGSGKTTLLNRLLREGPRSAVLINEFGSVPIDQKLITEQNIPLMTLSGGCLCCQVRGALAPVLRNIRLAWRQPGAPEFDRVIIETSGVASPEPVLDTLLRDHWLSRNYRLDAIIALLAAPVAESILDRHAEAQAQVAWADRLWISQTDLATPSQIEALRARLRQLAPTTPILDGADKDMALEALTRPLVAGPRRLPEGRDGPDHSFQSLAVPLPVAVSWHSLRQWLTLLLDRHPEIVRVKGIVHLADQFEPAAIHAVAQHLYPPVPLSARVTEDRQGRLVFITEISVHSLAESIANLWPDDWTDAGRHSH
ncbi:MAG: CobW family GTP-binding protein [Methylococcus sp.]